MLGCETQPAQLCPQRSFNGDTRPDQLASIVQGLSLAVAGKASALIEVGLNELAQFQSVAEQHFGRDMEHQPTHCLEQRRLLARTQAFLKCLPTVAFFVSWSLPRICTRHRPN